MKRLLTLSLAALLAAALTGSRRSSTTLRPSR